MRFFKTTIVSLLVAALNPAGVAASAPAIGQGFAAEMRADRIVITHGEIEIAHFVFADSQVLRPHFAHVRALDGTPVTRSHPPVEGVDPTDHATMHPGVWMGFGDINGVDFWRNKGTIRHEGFLVPPRVTAGKLEFVELCTLVAPDSSALGRMESRVRIQAHREGYILSWTARFSGTDGELRLGDQEEMGFGIRVATPITEKNGGSILNSAGASGASNTWGRTADWCEYSGVAGGRRMGIAVLTDTANFRPSWMHSRDYGLIVANPFGRKAFTSTGDPSVVVVNPGESLEVRFGAFVYSCPQEGRPDVDAAQRAFIEDGKVPPGPGAR